MISLFPRVAAGRKYQKTIRDKTKKDGNKAATFTKIVSAISSVVAHHGPDPAGNMLLSGLLKRARSVWVRNSIGREQGEVGI